MKAAAIQINTQNDKQANLTKALSWIEKAALDGAKFVLLPEHMNHLTSSRKEKISEAEIIPGLTSQLLSAKAKQLGIYIHCGSIAEKGNDNKVYNSSLLFNDRGEIVAKYRKIHLFDVDLKGKVTSRESDTVIPGNEIITASTPVGKIGFSICYDLRFPELYRSLVLRGAEILVVPAAFSLYTGINHWEALLRARAIENQCYVIAADQIGCFAPGKSSFGASMIIDPNGTVLARAPEEEGFIIADIDLSRIAKTRANIPCLTHRRPELYNRN